MPEEPNPRVSREPLGYHSMGKPHTRTASRCHICDNGHSTQHKAKHTLNQEDKWDKGSVKGVSQDTGTRMQSTNPSVRKHLNLLLFFLTLFYIGV